MSYKICCKFYCDFTLYWAKWRQKEEKKGNGKESIISSWCLVCKVEKRNMVFGLQGRMLGLQNRKKEKHMGSM